MPPTPYNSHTNPSIYYGPAPTYGPQPPQPVAPGTNPFAAQFYQAGGTSGQSATYPWGGYGAEPPGYQGGGLPPANNPFSPPAPTGGPGYETWNGYRILQHGPGGNVLVDRDGVPTAYDQWGNLLPHLYAGYNHAADGSGNGQPAPATPAATPPGGVSAPAPGTPPTFYGPTTASPYLQLQNLLPYLDANTRAQLNDTLTGAGFQPTGAMTTYGTSDYVRPAQFDENDLAKLVMNDNLRQWMRFFLGNLGWGISYQLPGGYTPGTGAPPAPPAPPNPPA